MEIRLQPQGEYLRVEATGPFDIAVAREAVGRIRDECVRRGLKRVLVDARGLGMGVSIADRFDLARALAEGCTGGVRFAILVRPAQLTSKTLEDTAVNRGVPVRTTADAAEAYGFLGIPPPG